MRHFGTLITTCCIVQLLSIPSPLAVLHSCCRFAALPLFPPLSLSLSVSLSAVLLFCVYLSFCLTLHTHCSPSHVIFSLSPSLPLMLFHLAFCLSTLLSAPSLPLSTVMLVPISPGSVPSVSPSPRTLENSLLRPPALSQPHSLLNLPQSTEMWPPAAMVEGEREQRGREVLSS